MKKRKTRKIKVGNLFIGGNSPIIVQSMTNTDTKDIKATVFQIKRLEKLGCEIIRVSVPDIESAKALKKIKRQITIPLVADIHFDYKLAIASIENGADKIRINPGNIGSKEKVGEIIKIAKKNKISIRIGINSGSLERDILKKYNDKVTAQGLVESTLRSIKLVESFNFKDIIVSIKAPNVLLTIETCQLLAQKGDWPIHLGITEAGRSDAGIVKSSLGIGYLLLQGIGDTIRVSLSGPPEQEVKVGWDILKSLNLRKRGVEIISCPTCARTKIPVEQIAQYIEETGEDFIEKPIKIAVMGCVVNGLGEAKESDFAFVGMENKKIGFFKNGKFVCYQNPLKFKKFIKKNVFFS